MGVVIDSTHRAYIDDCVSMCVNILFIYLSVCLFIFVYDKAVRCGDGYIDVDVY